VTGVLDKKAAAHCSKKGKASFTGVRYLYLERRNASLKVRRTASSEPLGEGVFMRVADFRGDLSGGATQVHQTPERVERPAGASSIAGEGEFPCMEDLSSWKGGQGRGTFL